MTPGATLSTLLQTVVVAGGALTMAAGLIWWERRLLGFWQERRGPNRVGPFGLLQVLADTIKILAKEDWVPPFADRGVFILAPAVVMLAGLMILAVIPVAPDLGVADLNVGLLFFLAMSSLGAYSVILAGWASASKYSLLGGLRSAAQLLSYEVFMGLSLLGVVAMTGSFNLRAIVEAQQGMWNIVPQFAGFVDLPDRRPGRDPSPALRPARGRGRAGGRVPRRVLGHEVRHVLRGRVPGHRRHLRR